MLKYVMRENSARIKIKVAGMFILFGTQIDGRFRVILGAGMRLI